MDVPLMPNQWIPIGERPRSVTVATEQLTWTQVVNPILSIARAHELAEAGAVLLASRHDQDRIVLLVRPSTRHQRRVAVGAGNGM
jgi:hypothetical protein